MQHLRHTQREVGVGDAGPQQVRRVAEPGEGGHDLRHQVGHGVRSAVRQLGFGVPPHPLVRIQLRPGAGERLQPQPWAAPQDRAEQRSAMNRAGVPEDDDRAPEMAQELAEKGADIGRPDIGTVELEVEAALPSPGAEREGRNNGQAIVALPVAEERRLAPRGPRPSDRGDQEEPGFVDEDEVGAQPRGVFFTRGQSCCFHRAIAASSRWSARRSGFCGVQPN